MEEDFFVRKVLKKEPYSFTSLSVSQKLFISKVWEVLLSRKTLEAHAEVVFREFIERNPGYLRHFDFVNEDGVYENSPIHVHSHAVFRFLDWTFTRGLENERLLERTVMEIAEKHESLQLPVGKEDFKELLDFILDYFLGELGERIVTPSLERGFRTLFGKLAEKLK